VPVFGDLIRHTFVPVLARMIWPLIMRKIFGPNAESPEFRREFPKEMALRPAQIRASAEESALMLPDALHHERQYQNLKMPLVIIAGADDRLIDTRRQSHRLHQELDHSVLHVVKSSGHMIHHSAPQSVIAAIGEVEAAVQVTS